MKEILKSGTFLFLRLIAVAVMCLIVTVSIGMLAIAAFTENTQATAISISATIFIVFFIHISLFFRKTLYDFKDFTFINVVRARTRKT